MKLATAWPRSGHALGLGRGGEHREPKWAETAHGRAKGRGLARGSATVCHHGRGRLTSLFHNDGKACFGGQIGHNLRANWTLLL